jgi:hypothetical protein
MAASAVMDMETSGYHGDLPEIAALAQAWQAQRAMMCNTIAASRRSANIFAISTPSRLQTHARHRPGRLGRKAK